MEVCWHFLNIMAQLNEPCMESINIKIISTLGPRQIFDFAPMPTQQIIVEPSLHYVQAFCLSI